MYGGKLSQYSHQEYCTDEQKKNSSKKFVTVEDVDEHRTKRVTFFKSDLPHDEHQRKHVTNIDKSMVRLHSMTRGKEGGE